MKVVVTDWEFSTARPCDKCGNRPGDYWEMAKVKGNYICILCLGEMVVAHE